MANITAEKTIDAFREYISTWGLPVKVVTDNGPTFTSEMFANFLKKNGIKHIKTPPYHPASNGAAENAVKTFKTKFKLLIKEGMPRKEALSKYLFHYRSSPHCTTGVSPAELQIGQKFRTRWDLLRAEVGETVYRKQLDQKKYFHGGRNATFNKSDIVMAKDYRNNNWQKSEIDERLGPVTYSIKTSDNLQWKRHLDQLRPCNADSLNVSKKVDQSCNKTKNVNDLISGQMRISKNIDCKVDSNNGVSIETDNTSVKSENQQKSIDINNQNLSEKNNEFVTVRRSNRTRKKTVKLDL